MRDSANNSTSVSDAMWAWIWMAMWMKMVENMKSSEKQEEKFETKLLELKTLFDKWLISEADYESKKKEILNKM